MSTYTTASFNSAAYASEYDLSDIYSDAPVGVVRSTTYAPTARYGPYVPRGTLRPVFAWSAHPELDGASRITANFRTF